MKVMYNSETVYIGYVSEDMKYALVSKGKYGESPIFKVDIANLEGLPEKGLESKLKKFIRTKGS